MNAFEQAYNNHMDKQEAKLRDNVERQLDAAELKSQVARKVVVTDLDMPFRSMVNFMVKWALAAIPATLILGIFFALAAGFVMSLMGGLPY